MIMSVSTFDTFIGAATPTQTDGCAIGGHCAVRCGALTRKGGECAHATHACDLPTGHNTIGGDRRRIDRLVHLRRVLNE